MNVPKHNSPKPGSWVLAPINDQDKRRRSHLAIFLPILIVSLFVFAVLNFRVNNLVIGGLQVSLSVVLLISLIGLRYVQNAFPMFRVNIALLSMLGIYSAWAGNYQGAAILSLYLYPVILFYFLGKLEGSIWVSLVLIPSLFVLFVPDSIGAYVYEEPYRIRLAATILLVTFFSYITESLREKAYEDLALEKENLSRALVEIKTLRGIIPICSYCKVIRNDEGAWEKLEAYITRYSDAVFSHGVCPGCAAKVLSETESQ